MNQTDTLKTCDYEISRWVPSRNPATSGNVFPMPSEPPNYAERRWEEPGQAVWAWVGVASMTRAGVGRFRARKMVVASVVGVVWVRTVPSLLV